MSQPRRTAAEIVDAIAASAHRLFVAHGPAAVSLRHIAGDAQVNLGQIHRYVGSKDEVVALVLDRHGDAATVAVGRTAGLDDLLDLVASSPSTSSARLFAGILLDDLDAIRLKREFPVVDALNAALVEEAPDVDPATTAALLQSLVLGWEIFAPYLLAAAGASPPADERVLLRAALQALVDRPT